ncbi:hypothetical protein GCM10010353_36230 [Streptomyces chryseus]|nr:hypothetical protein GCM10010353_36230 [Streptomyces chryseus]
MDTTGGVRLLGVGVTGLADFTQEDLFAQAAGELAEAEAEAGAAREAAETAEGGGGAGDPVAPPVPEPEPHRRWLAGQDVRHTEYGAGWVQGSGVGRVTVRFEEPTSPPGRVRTFPVDDPDLAPSDPLPLVRAAGDQAGSSPASRPKSRSGAGEEMSSP